MSQTISLSESWRALLAPFTSLKSDEKVIWLGNLISTLTIAGRDTYAAETEQVEDPPELRRVNELIHQSSSHLVGIAANHDRYPDEVFLEIILEGLTRLKSGGWVVLEVIKYTEQKSTTDIADRMF